jgi:glutamate synthase (ferredoxin)
MGISTMRSYHGAQIFEAVGLRKDVIDRYFTLTPSRLEGIGLEEIAQENQMRHDSAYAENPLYADTLESGGCFQCKDDGEIHCYNPETIYLLQRACREGDYNLYKEYSRKINDEAVFTLRNLLAFNINPKPSHRRGEPVNRSSKGLKPGNVLWLHQQEAHNAGYRHEHSR